MYLEQTVIELKNEVTELLMLIEELININKDVINERPTPSVTKAKGKSTKAKEEVESEPSIDEIDSPTEKVTVNIDTVKALILKKIQGNVARKDIQKTIASCGGNDNAKLADLNNSQLLIAAEKIEAL